MRVTVDDEALRDPVPDEVLQRAKAAFATKAPSGELLALTESVVDLQGDDRPESRLTFAAAAGVTVRVDVRLSPEGHDATRVDVDVTPPDVEAVEVEMQNDTGGVLGVARTSPQAGHRGPYAFSLPRALVRLHIVGSPGHPSLYTEWLRL